MTQSLPVFVGLDYHQQSVQVCVLDADGRQLLNRPVDNDWQAIAAATLRVGVVQRAGIESCSGAADLAQQLCDLAGWSIDLAHPGYVNRMKQSPDKSDFSDGRMIADLVRVGYLPKVWLAPEPVRELRRLVRHRQTLADQRRAAKLRIGAVLREQRLRCRSDASRWSKPWNKWLSEEAALSHAGRFVVDRLLAQLDYLAREIARAEKELARVSKGDAVVKKLLSLAGIGPVTAWVIRAAVGRFDRFATAKQLARYCGLSPRNASSGQRTADAGLVKAGDKLLRATLIETAHRLIRTQPRWKQMAQSMRRRGKHPCLIAAAVANRFVRTLFHEMKERPAPTCR